MRPPLIAAFSLVAPLIVTVVGLLAGCGGGGPEPARPQAAVRPAAAAAPATAASSAIKPEQLFGWAEQQHAALFPKGAATQQLTAAGVAYTLRYYASTGNYLGVGLNDGLVWGYGPFNGLQLQSFGTLGSYACAVDRALCHPGLGPTRYTTTHNGDTRDYIVHVPQGYTGLQALPVVLALHGAGGNGERFYNTSGWVQTGEANNVITVFPSAWVYACVFDDGVNKKNSAKWTSDDLVLCGGSNDHLRDDVTFLRQVVDEVSGRLAVDGRRVYLVGFSNGGEMAARAAVDMGDRLAAVVADAGGLGAVVTPRRREMPLTLQLGNRDDNLLKATGASALPMNFAQLFSQYPMLQAGVDVWLQTFNLDTRYAVSGSAGSVLVATYAGLSGLPQHQFRFVLVKDLDHAYPNGSNHPLKGSDEHWAWLRNFTLP